MIHECVAIFKKSDGVRLTKLINRSIIIITCSNEWSPRSAPKICPAMILEPRKIVNYRLINDNSLQEGTELEGYI